MSHRAARLEILDEVVQRPEELESERRAIEQPIRPKQGRQTKAHTRKEGQDVSRDWSARGGVETALHQQQPADKGQQREGALLVRGGEEYARG